MRWADGVDQQLEEQREKARIYCVLRKLVDLELPVTIRAGVHESYGVVEWFDDDHFRIALDPDSIYDYWVFPNLMLRGVEVGAEHRLVLTELLGVSGGKIRGVNYRGVPFHEKRQDAGG